MLIGLDSSTSATIVGVAMGGGLALFGWFGRIAVGYLRSVSDQLGDLSTALLTFALRLESLEHLHGMPTTVRNLPSAAHRHRSGEPLDIEGIPTRRWYDPHGDPEIPS